jgi:ribA/ribD-fused uncharacterized protein
VKKILNRKELEEHSKKNKLEFTFFFGHTNYKEFITPTCFSQWYPSPFVEDGVDYPDAEHYMMARKAMLFSDEGSLKKILASKDPARAKFLGRKVTGFDHGKWEEHKFDIVLQGSLLKFSQNQELGEFLLSTNDNIIVEASPFDPVWGIGMSAGDPYAKHPKFWAGENLLGFALMETRRQLKKTLK